MIKFVITLFMVFAEALILWGCGWFLDSRAPRKRFKIERRQRGFRYWNTLAIVEARDEAHALKIYRPNNAPGLYEFQAVQVPDY